MNVKNKKEVVDIHVAGKTGTMLYKERRLVWEAVKSCFGRGMWVDEKGWVNNDGWRNNR